MPPRERQSRSIHEPTEQERHAMIAHRVQMQIVEPIGPHTANFFQCLHNAMNPVHGIPEVWETIDNMWKTAPDREMEPKRKADYIIEQLPRAATALLLPQNPDFTKGIYWPDFLSTLEESRVRHEFVMQTMLPIMSNKFERGKLIDRELKAHGLLDGVIALELGSGGNHIGKGLVERWPYPPTRVMERVRIGSKNRIRENPKRSKDFDETIAQSLDVKRVIGVDKYNPEDPFFKIGRLACTLTLDERAIPTKVEEVNKLEAIKLENVIWQWGDITNYTPAEYRQEFPGEPLPSITFASFVIYLLKKHEQQLALQNLAAFAIESGNIAAVLDDIRSIDTNHQPHIVPRRRDFSTTGLWVFNGKYPKDGWLKHFSVRTGRIDAVIPEPAFTNIKL